VNRQVTLAARPDGFPKHSDFALVESEIPQPGPAEVLVHSQWLSVDPYMRGRMSEARSYAKPTELGEPMTGQVVGEVVESDDSRFAPGDTVVGQLGWQEYAVARGGTLRKVDPSLAPVQTASSTSASRSRATPSSSRRHPAPSVRSSANSRRSPAAGRSSGSPDRPRRSPT
jgi:NADPH-dependent curcumin reductase CurA